MRFATVAAIAAALLLVTPVSAAELATPTGRVILTVTGDIENVNAGDIAEFDAEMLAALEQGSITTTTPWYETARTFSGPLGTAFLKAVGARGTTLRVTAINDFVSEIPLEDMAKHGVVMATEIDGQAISVRERGPIFVMYPFDANEGELRNQLYESRAIWQVKAIEVY